MQHDARHGHIAFLLSLGSATLGCDFDTSGTACGRPEEHADDGKDEDDDEDEDAGSTSGSTGDAETGGGDGTGDAPATEGGGDDAPAGTTGEPGGGETTAGAGDTSMCQPYVDHYIECFPSGDAQALLDGCIYSIEAGHTASPACGSAVEDWYACLVQTPCEVVQNGEPYCESERAAVDGECPAQETTG